MLVLFTNLCLVEFQVWHLAIFLLFSVIDSFKWFSMGSIHKNIQLMLEFLKSPFLVQHFSYYTLMTSLLMLSVILLSMLMKLLSIYSKQVQAPDLWQQLKLVSEPESDLWDTVDWSRKWLVDFNAGKTWLVLFDHYNITMTLLMQKWMDLFLRKNHLLRCCDWLSLINWIGSSIISTA